MKKTNAKLTAYVLLASAGAMCFMYENDIILSLIVSLSIFAGIALWSLLNVHVSKASLLARLMIIIYCLPFIHLFPYLTFDYTTTRYMWGMASNPYQFDQEIIHRMAMVGCIGAMGLVSGLMLIRSDPNQRSSEPRVREPSLDLVSSIAVAIVVLALSWLNAPTDTIFQTRYSQSINPLDLAKFNFSGAWMVAHILTLLLYLDSLNEIDARLRWLKLRITFFVLALVVVYFQFLRGDRECIGLIAGIIALYILDNPNLMRRFDREKLNRSKMFKVALVGIAVVVVAQLLGSIRSKSEGEGFWGAISQLNISVDTFISGTWSGVLLSILSVVGDFYNGRMELRWGSTYVDYVLSLPPGPVTQYFGYERPIEAMHGPAWEMRYGIGGTHALVVPFMNFKSFGVLGVLLIYGLLIAWLERRTACQGTLSTKLLYGSAFVGSFTWFWYGEMSAIRMLMTFFGVWFVYLVLPKRRVNLGGPSLSKLGLGH